MNGPARLPIEVGQLWEGRAARRDGSRERVRIVALDGRSATIESENPRPPLLARRTVGILVQEISGCVSLGNMRLVEMPDGRRVSWPPGGGCVEGAAI